MQVLEDDLLDPNEVSKKLIQLEDRSWHNNLQFDGLKRTLMKLGMTVNEKYTTSFLID